MGLDQAFGLHSVPALDAFSGSGQMQALVRLHDWASTPFGPPETWPQSLRSVLGICLESEFQIAIYWGPELALIYNDSWSLIPGDKHPWALGRPAREVWPEIWETIGPLFASVLATGRATRSKDALLAMRRRGFTEECYFDYTFSPIRDEAGEVSGIFNIAVETTFRILEERRQRCLRMLKETVATARTALRRSPGITGVCSPRLVTRPASGGDDNASSLFALRTDQRHCDMATLFREKVAILAKRRWYCRGSLRSGRLGAGL